MLPGTLATSTDITGRGGREDLSRTLVLKLGMELRSLATLSYFCAHTLQLLTPAQRCGQLTTDVAGGIFLLCPPESCGPRTVLWDKRGVVC